MRLKNESSLNSTSLRSTNMSSPQSLKLRDKTVEYSWVQHYKEDHAGITYFLFRYFSKVSVTVVSICFVSVSKSSGFCE